MKILLACGFYFLLFLRVFSQNTTYQDSVSITEPVLSYKNSFHNTDGFLVTLSDGTIIQFFRQDSVDITQHVGNYGKIVQRRSFDHGQSWTNPILVYSDSFDDRNIHGGLLENDVIFLTFRRYNALTGQHVNYNMMYSYDSGSSWSYPTVFNTIGACSGTSSLCKVPGLGYLFPIYKQDYVELRLSPDGYDWQNVVKVWNYVPNHQFRISESSVTYCGQGRIIVLFRNDRKMMGETVLMAYSLDFGNTWSELLYTNIADGFHCPSPWSFYDELRDEYWVIVNDRRGEMIDSVCNHEDESFWIYRNRPEEVIENAESFHLFNKMQRPEPSFYRLYGYPISTWTADGNVLVMFTENEYRSSPNKGEWPYFYQFYINFDVSTDVLQSQIDKLVSVFPNPATREAKITGKAFTTDEISYFLTGLDSRVLAGGKILPGQDKVYELSLLIDNIPSGLYVVSMVQGNEQWSIRIVKE